MAMVVNNNLNIEAISAIIASKWGLSMEMISASEKETHEAGKKFAERLTGGSVVALYGGLGVGKTAFVRGLAE